MSSATRITLATLRNVKPGTTLWDSDVRGFCVRCRNGGTLTYGVKSRAKGRQRWITIGRHGSPWTPDTARKEALRILARMSTGDEVKRETAAKAQQGTLAFVCEKFIAIHGPKLKPTTFSNYVYIINGDILPAFGKRRLDDITRADCAKFHASMADRPRLANLTLAVLSRILTWATDHGYRPPNLDNPTEKIVKYREVLRERYLSTSEIVRLGEVLDRFEQDGTESLFAVAAIRLLLLTGARRNEILLLTWAEVDLERGVLRLRDSKTGPKLVRLSPKAVDLLANLPRLKGNPHVIVGHRTGGHLINLRKVWLRARKEAGLDDVRLHDLRHSYASIAISAGASLPMVGKLLGHTQPRTTARYAHLADDPVNRMGDMVGDSIAASLSKSKTSEPLA